MTLIGSTNRVLFFLMVASLPWGWQAICARPSVSQDGVQVRLGVERSDANSREAHRQLVAKTKQGTIDVYFVGDSITRRWGATDYPAFLEHWKSNFHGWNAANFGWGSDTTQNMLWRMQNGELEGVQPRVFVLQGGTNNLPSSGSASEAKIDEIVGDLKAIVALFRHASPNATVILTGVFPRNQNPNLTQSIKQINDRLAQMADGKQIRWININAQIGDAEGKLLPGMSEDGLHLNLKSYQVWADALHPILSEVLGPRKSEDHAPPPTGDPSAAKRTAIVASTSSTSSTNQRTASTTKSDQRGLRPSTPGGADVPEVLRIPRPTEDELEIVKRAWASFVQSADSRTKEVLQSFPNLVEVREPRPNTAIVPNLLQFFRQKHESNKVIAKQGGWDLLFMGDSITDFWRNADGPFAGKPVFDQYFGMLRVANFGIAGDTTQGVLYRLKHGEGEGFQPKAVMLMIGTNNTGNHTAPEIAEGIGAVVLEVQNRFPESKTLLLAVFPRGDAKDPVRGKIQEINQLISRLHDGKRVHYLDIGDKFLDSNGNIPKDVMTDALHPSTKGYEIWAQAVQSKLVELMQR